MDFKEFFDRTMGIMMFSLKLLWLDLKCNFNKKDIVRIILKMILQFLTN